MGSVESSLRFVVITACPTGVALTYMAANRLSSAGQRLGYTLKIETQGAMGSEDVLTRKDIAKADAAILATDIEVEGLDRFDGMPLLRVGTGQAISDPEKVLADAAALAGRSHRDAG